MTVDLQINPLNAEGLLEGQFELDVGGQLGRGKLIFMSDDQSTLRSEFSHLQHTPGGPCQPAGMLVSTLKEHLFSVDSKEKCASNSNNV